MFRQFFTKRTNKKIANFAIFPQSFLTRVILGKLKDETRFFISEKDYRNIRFVGNSSVIGGICMAFVQIFVFNIDVYYSLIISFLFMVSTMLIFGGHIKAKIIQLHQRFDEEAFLVLNSLSINMVSTDSFFLSVNTLLNENMDNVYYNKYFREIIFSANLGKSEDEVIGNAQKIFLLDRYKEVFSNINKSVYLSNEPEFLQRIKRKIGIIEDYIVIFIAISSIFPLSLTFILSMFSQNTASNLLLFPFFYAIISSLILRFMQNKFLVS